MHARTPHDICIISQKIDRHARSVQYWAGDIRSRASALFWGMDGVSDVPGEDLRLGDVVVVVVVVVWRACVRAAVFMVFFGDWIGGEWMGGEWGCIHRDGAGVRKAGSVWGERMWHGWHG